MIRFLQITDSHLFSNRAHKFLGIKSYETFKAVTELAKKHIRDRGADFVVFTGDLSHDGSEKSYQHFVSLAEELSVKKIWIPGNHDRLKTGLKVLENAGISSQKVIQQDHWQLIFLNSFWKWHIAGKLSKKELQFLEKTLEQGEELKNFVFLHHHPLKLNCKWLDGSKLKNSDAFLEAVHRHKNIVAVAFGHVHSEQKLTFHGVDYLGSPSSSVQFMTKEQQFKLDAVM
ncbi:MAG: metallophosphoesterase, partial [Gammaproteobacteria bacterium]|nr:metallophosphoesterase [Gammaproteobacteria bacterium]